MAIALTIDLGTTNLKVGLVDVSGQLLRVESAPVPVVSNENGAAEHDPEELKKLILRLSTRVLADGGKDDVAYVVSSTYQFGLMLLDQHRQPLTGMTLLTDIRSQRTFDAFVEELADIDIYQRTGCPLMSPYALARLYYFSKEEPQLFDRIGYVADSKAFLFEWLSGEFVTDISTAAATQHYEVSEGDWDEVLLGRLGFRSGQFPRIEEGTSYIAELQEGIRAELGLKQGVKVLLGIYDGAALAVGLGGLQPGVGIINVGTSAMLRVPGTVPAFDRSDNKRIQPYAVNKHLFLNGGALNNAALPLNWLRDELFDVDVQSAAMLELGVGPPLLCLPYLSSERDSKTGPFASGVFFGLRPYHGKTDMARAVLEGVAYSMRYLLDALKENHLPVHELRMGGGGTRIAPWPQIFANILGVPVLIPSGDEMALVGSAMLAFVADGLHPDIAALSKQIIRSPIAVEPDTKTLPVHDERYAFFKKVRETLAPLYQEHAGLSR